MKYKSKILFLAFFLSFSCFSQVKNENQLFLNKTFGFIYGQQHTLNIIKQNFPEQIIEASIAELEFDKSFSRALSNINIEIRKIHGSAFEDYLSKIKDISDKYFSSNKMSKKDAVLFIEKVKSRAKGNIKSPFLETLLKYEHLDNPVDELLNNHANIYSVINYSNSRMMKLEIKIPQSWKELDGDSSLILKKFRSEYGLGKEIITVSKKLISNRLITDNLFTEKELQKMIPKNSKIPLIDTENINNKLTGIIRYEQINPTIKSNQKRYIIQYSFKYNNTLLIIECAIYGVIEDDLNLKFQKFNPLFQSIVKSVKINNNSNKNKLSVNQY